MPDRKDIAAILAERHGPEIQARIEQGVVGVMGLGGLGSSVAAALVRIGIGKLLLADYDTVELSNLNRQYYFADQIGLPKTVALRDTLLRINPYVCLETIHERLTEERIPLLFKGVDVLVECFDDPAMKPAALRAARGSLRGIGYVGASGMAGFGDNNRIVTRRIYPRVYLVGDSEAEVGPNQGLMAPRVGIAAHHQANQALRLLLGVDEDTGS
ncbi:MAG: sulfur carrier protein ThiS adenylyltransferase ThiF [Deltaproteobacteria bacterium]|nr:sulfur carrier protein ThiS adenylyltransferase ThiF [Deltaproteobacteria bacterium]